MSTETNQFKKIKQSFQKALILGVIDKNIIHTLNMLNDDTRIATRNACEGHLDKREKGISFYIQFIHNSHYDLIVEIYSSFLDKLIKHNKANKNDSYEPLALSLTFDLSIENNNDLIKTVNISYCPYHINQGPIFTSEEHKLLFINYLNEAIKETLKNRGEYK